jgi:hypothetical protein
MPAKQQAGTHPPIELDLRAKGSAEALSQGMKRFDIFLIDTGWNRPISKVVRSHLRLLYEYQMKDTLYDPRLIGCDPSIVVYDIYGSGKANAGTYRGFRLNLGLLRHPEQALIRLQEFIRFLAANRTAERLDREIRRELHREGVDGMIKLLRETSSELLGE